MENKEIITNDEIVDTTEGIAMSYSEKAIKIVAGTGLALLAGFITYKYIIKPITAKIKAKKDQKAIDTIESQCVEVEDSDSNED